MKTRTLSLSLVLFAALHAGLPAVIAAHAGHAELAGSAYTPDSIYQVPLAFTDDQGRPATLGQWRGRPVILTMFYASCTSACPMLASDMERIRAAVPESLRSQVAMVLVTFDPERDSIAALASYKTSRGLDASWSLLRTDAVSVRTLAALLGVSFRREANGDFAHTNQIAILNSEGGVIHRRMGLSGGLGEAARAVADVARLLPEK